MLRGVGRGVSSGMKMAASGARRFSGYGPQLRRKGVNSIGLHGAMAYKKGFSTAGKVRMGAAGAALGMAGFHNNANRGGYKSGYIPKSSATQGLNPRSSGGMTMM
jgi:hypothetical protein